MSCHHHHEAHQSAHSCGGESHCGGGCCGGCCGGHCDTPQAIELSEGEYAFLMGLAEIPFLPLARFVLSSTRSEHVRSVALSPVYLTERDAGIEDVRKTGGLLLGLEEKGLISLDYDQPLQGCDYADYHNSAAYRRLQAAVAEGRQQAGFLFDQAEMELGSIALTALGRHTIEQLSPA